MRRKIRWCAAVVAVLVSGSTADAGPLARLKARLSQHRPGLVVQSVGANCAGGVCVPLKK